MAEHPLRVLLTKIEKLEAKTEELNLIIADLDTENSELTRKIDAYEVAVEIIETDLKKTERYIQEVRMFKDVRF